MKIVFFVISAVCWLLCITTMLASKSAIHEILYVLFGVAAIISMGFGAVLVYLQGIGELMSKNADGGQEQKTDKMPEPQPAYDPAKWTN